MSQPAPYVFALRRLIALVLVGLILWGIFSAIGSFFAGFGAKPTATETPGQECAPGTVSVTAVVGDGKTERLSFDAGVNPWLWFTVTNTGTVTCKFNAGPRVTFFTIKSADEQIWTSRNCDRAGLVDKWVTLKSGQYITWPANEWYRVHSSDTGCGTGQDPVLPGAYSLTAEVNGVISNNYEQFLLN
ncbi:MAG: hypothetical protein RLZZ108_211 [Actinomycetota bacterium]|jgi:hypothetical protein